MFSRLKVIRIRGCPKIDKLFWPELTRNLKSLEKISVSECEQLVEIIAASNDEEENKEAGKDAIIFALPTIRELYFRNLPQLKSICGRGSLMKCDFLQEINILDCPKLKRIPLLLPQNDRGQLYPPPALNRIEVRPKALWDSLEWDQPNVQNLLLPYCVFMNGSDHIQELHIKERHDLRSLSDHISSLKYTSSLKHCSISNCRGIECLISSSSYFNILQSIERLSVEYLNNFSALFRGERDGAASILPTPKLHDMFPRLKYIEIRNCSKIKNLFWPELVHNLRNLEEIHVHNCKQLVEIIAPLHDDEEINKEVGKESIKFALPKLKIMVFRNLPQLKCICSRGSRMECESPESIEIFDCPKLERIPLLNPRINYPKVIRAFPKEWWDSLKWDDPDIKKALEPLVGSSLSLFALPLSDIFKSPR